MYVCMYILSLNACTWLSKGNTDQILNLIFVEIQWCWAVRFLKLIIAFKVRRQIFLLHQASLKFLWLRSYKSRDSAVGIATGYWMDDRGIGVRVPVGSSIFNSLCRSDRLWGPPNLLSNAYPGALSPGLKRPGCEVDNSPPTSAEVKKTWVCTATPQHAFIA
jgi:hypothetical protein